MQRRELLKNISIVSVGLMLVPTSLKADLRPLYKATWEVGTTQYAVYSRSVYATLQTVLHDIRETNIRIDSVTVECLPLGTPPPYNMV